MSDSKFIRGTLIVTIGTFLVKFLGMIYVIPFYSLVGTQGGALYNYGYVPYTIFLSIATAGVPLAVSKFVSKYNELGDYRTSRKMLTSGFKLMSVTAVISFLILYTIAPLVASRVLTNDPHGNTLEDVTMVIRMTSFALLVVPIMSLIRGFFQGHQSMGPTTVSQVVEQIVRIAFLLGASFFVIKVFDGSVATAVGWSTFAATVGALGGLAVLVWYWVKRKSNLDVLLNQSVKPVTMTTWEMYKELLTYAGPFVLVGIANPLYQQVDTLTFNKAMEAIGQAAIAEEAYGIFTVYSHKLIMIPVSLATAFSLTLVPAITKLHTMGDRQALHRQISQTFQMTMFLTLPAVVGISVLSYPLYTAFYEWSTLGIQILAFYAPVALFFAFYSVNAAVLQGINQQKYAVLSVIYGVLVKIILNVPLIKLFETKGAILATGLGYFVSIAFTFWQIKRHTGMNFNIVKRRFLLMGIYAGAMAVSVIGTQWVLSLFLAPDNSRLHALLTVSICAIVGAGVYLTLAWKSNLVGKVLGHDLSQKLKRKLKRGK